MSSRINIRRGKGDRPRSSDKLKKPGRKETPEKPTTPQDTLHEEDGEHAQKSAIINDEIRALQIKTEDLQKMRENKSPREKQVTTPVKTEVVVRKLKPASEWDKPPPKYVTVARPAHPDAPLKPVDYIGGAGPRFDSKGNILPHSILGSIENYKNEAIKRGDLPAEVSPTKDDKQLDTLTVKYEKKKKTFPKFMSVEESNALKTWQQRMLERRKQQGYLSKLLGKPEEQLVMNQADSYRSTQELRYIIDRTMQTVDYGKGYRIGSEFWKQQERIGDDLTGVHMTLSQTEKGYPPPVEHVGVPKGVLDEKGTDWQRPRTPFHKPWHKSAYLDQRKKQLQPMMNELDPHKPDLLNLEIVGSSGHYEEETARHTPDRDFQSQTELRDIEEDEFREMNIEDVDPLKDHPDVHLAPIFGPSLQFGGQPARWTGDAISFRDQIGIEARVMFEAYAGYRTTSFLEIANDGTTCIYYDWKKNSKANPFNLANPKVQRFYFNAGSGVILPGDSMKFPFVFKSPNAGVFSEQWRFETNPVVCGGADLVVTLRGVSLQEDKYRQQRSELEEELAHKQTEQIVDGILYDILESIRTPERARSPIDAYITEDEIFVRKNPQLIFSNEPVEKLKGLYLETFPEDERDGQEWDLSIDTLKQSMMCMADEEKKQELLETLNHTVISLSFPPFTPKQQQMYKMGYELLCEMVDSISSQDLQLRTMLSMPDTEDEANLSEHPTGLTTQPSKDDTTTSANDPDTHRTASEMKRSGATKGKAAEAKDKKSAKGHGKTQKEQTTKGGKVTPGSKRPQTREKDRISTPASDSQSPVPPTGDPVLQAKYKEKFNTLTYLIVQETFGWMEQIFSEIQQQHGDLQTPVM